MPAPRRPQALGRFDVELRPAGAERACACHLDPRRSARRHPALSPPRRECAFCPFDVLGVRFTMLLDEFPQQCSKRLAPFVFLQHTRNVTRDRIGASGADFAMDSHQLILRQTDGDLRSGHTRIIPRRSRGIKQASFSPTRCERQARPRSRISGAPLPDHARSGTPGVASRLHKRDPLRLHLSESPMAPHEQAEAG